jgi:hypothetical protein
MISALNWVVKPCWTSPTSLSPTTRVDLPPDHTAFLVQALQTYPARSAPLHYLLNQTINVWMPSLSGPLEALVIHGAQLPHPLTLLAKAHSLPLALGPRQVLEAGHPLLAPLRLADLEDWELVEDQASDR